MRLGYIDGQFVPFPTHDALEESDLDLIVSGSKDSILMIEGFAREIPEDRMVDAIVAAHGFIRQICEMQEELAEKIGAVKKQYDAPADAGFYDVLRAKYYDALRAAKQTEGKLARSEACAAVKKQAVAELIPDPKADGAIAPDTFAFAWETLETRVVRDQILTGVRPDGRDYKTLRPIECKVDLLPRVHGSAIFQRGETQALVTVTLGTGRDEQRVDGLVEEYSQKFMLHYYFPSFSVGEVRPIRGPGRREIGHGALAERSVKPVLPSPENFPYTIRIISDILESNGSSSMASVCGATLGLMSAGVPISNPVAGISVGLVKEPDRYVLLTDIIGDEDHFGDMDFKVAGTQNGITGIQLDLKIAGISEQIVRETLKQSREARIEILRKMLAAISRPRPEISPWAHVAVAHAHRPREDRVVDRTGRQDDPFDPRGHRRADRGRGRRHGEHCQQRHGRGQGGPEPRRGVDRVGRGRPDLRRPRDEHQGFRRLHRNSARQGRTLPHQRVGRRLRERRGRRLQGGRRDEGQGHRH